MNEKALRGLLTIFMCADPTPAEEEHDEELRSWLDKESKRHGFSCWVDAYHGLET